MIAAPAAIAANCLAVFHSSALFPLPLSHAPVSSSSGMTATVPTYRNVPAVNGSSISPQDRLVPNKPGESAAPVAVAEVPTEDP
ncbi:hypothetical protein LTR28_006854, partial [Elasticomyces elasticus]